MSEQNLKVGDDLTLDGHCMVAFPDGSVVTASRSIKLVMPGEYRVIYADDDTETVVVYRADPDMDADEATATDDTTPTVPEDTAPDAPHGPVPPVSTPVGPSVPTPIKPPLGGESGE